MTVAQVVLSLVVASHGFQNDMPNKLPVVAQLTSPKMSGSCTSLAAPMLLLRKNSGIGPQPERRAEYARSGL